MRVRDAALPATVWFALVTAATFPATAQEAAANAFYEIETKYIFGFTEGSSIGLEGEKEFSTESFAALGKRDGRYAASQTKFEFEHTPTQFVQLEFGALTSTHDIKGVTDFDDRRSVEFMGLFGEFRYLVIGRGPSSPVGVTVSAEPVWRRIDETSGERVTNFELETKIYADLELVENRVYLGVNALYEPEWTRTGPGDLVTESTFGVSSAVAFRPVPQLLVGLELGYFRHYEGIAFSKFTGDALFFGPTLYLQLTRKSFLTAAWGVQVAGHAVDDPGPLNLADFARHRAKLKFAVEF